MEFSEDKTMLSTNNFIHDEIWIEKTIGRHKKTYKKN